MVWGAIAGALIGGGLSYFGAQSTNKANQAIASSAGAKNVAMMREGHTFSNIQARQAERFTTKANTKSWLRSNVAARRQERFQTEMSNTQFQRGMIDMRRAGLNPILAYAQGGAGTPSGAMAGAPSGQGVAASASSAQQPVIPMANELEAGVSSAKQNIRLTQEIKNMKQSVLTDRARQHDLQYSKYRNNAQTVLTETQANSERIRQRTLEQEAHTAKAVRTIKEREAKDVKAFGTSEWSKNLGGLLRILDTLGLTDGLVKKGKTFLDRN